MNYVLRVVLRSFPSRITMYYESYYGVLRKQHRPPCSLGPLEEDYQAQRLGMPRGRSNVVSGSLGGGRVSDMVRGFACTSPSDNLCLV